MDPVAIGTLGELIATAITAAAGKSWRAIKSSPEANIVKGAIDQALADAFADAYRGPVTADDDWVTAVAGIWERAFTAEVSQALIRCLANVNGDQHEFTALAGQALRDSGCDVADLDRTFWVEQFLCVLPWLLFKQLEMAALDRDSAARDLVGHLLDQRAEARAASAQVTAATPRQFREDLIALLRRLDEEARTGRLPLYLPRGADVSRLARTVRVRRGVRTSLHPNGPAEDTAGRPYRLPVEQAEDDEPARPWPQVAAENWRLVVLADPGLGKSWLIRTETHRLCQQALAAAERGDDAGALLIPVPVRCDQLVASGGQSLAQAAAGYLVAQQLVPPRSRSGLQARIEAGQTVLLLDAVDELTTDEQYGRLKELLQSWRTYDDVGPRCVLTSRIAGYRGSPLPDACEVELQAFTPLDVTAAIAAWQLPPPATARVLARAKDPAVAGMTRIPLLLALLCSLAAELPDGQQLPATRGELYDRVLRWFLTRAHRAEERPSHPELGADEVDALLEILAPVAFHFATLPAGWTDLMPADQLRTAIRLAGRAFTERNRPAGDIVRELSTGAGILVPAGNPSAGRRPSYLFLHRTVAEYLVARHLATLPAADWLEVVDQHLWFDPDWAEVIPLLGGQLDPSAARRLVKHLLGQADDPFHHALLTAVRVMAERPDTDHLLPAKDLQDVADAVLGLIDNPVTADTTVSLLAPAPRLPRRIVDGLLALLSGPDGQVRRAAAAALAGREAPAVTDRLLALLRDPDWDMRFAAAEALAGREAPAVTDRLLALLGDPDGSVRLVAVDALAARSAPAVTGRLLALLGDPDTSVRLVAVRALAGREAPAVTDGLLALLGDSDWLVRGAAVNALAGREAPAVTDGLLARLGDPDPKARAAAVQALAGREAPGVTDRLLALLGDPDGQVRRAAAGALAGREAPAVTDRLLARLGDPEGSVRSAVVNALAGREVPVVTDRLLGLLRDPDPGLRAATADALAGREAPAVTDRLLALLGDPDWGVRRAAAAALAGQEAPVVTDRLLALLGDPDWGMRRAAADALAGQEAPAVTDGLLALLGDPDWRVRSAAVNALAGREAPAVTDRLLARLGDPDPEARAAAVRALAGREAPAVTDGLLALLGDPDWRVRSAAVNALAGRPPPVVTDRLLALLSDPDRVTRAAAVDALAGREEAFDLLSVARLVRTLNPASRGLAYEAVQQMAARIYLRLPAESQAGVRADLAWLTAIVCGSPGT